MHNDRSLMLNGIVSGFRHRIHGIKNIFSIAVNDPQVFKAPEVISGPPVGSLVPFMDRNSVIIVLKNKYNRQFFITGPVDGFIHITFAGGGFTL